MANFAQFAGSPDIFEKSTGRRITEQEARTLNLFTPSGLSSSVEKITTPRSGIINESDFTKLAGQPLSQQELATFRVNMPDQFDINQISQASQGDSIDSLVAAIQKQQNQLATQQEQLLSTTKQPLKTRREILEEESQKAGVLPLQQEAQSLLERLSFLPLEVRERLKGALSTQASLGKITAAEAEPLSRLLDVATRREEMARRQAETFAGAEIEGREDAARRLERTLNLQREILNTQATLATTAAVRVERARDDARAQINTLLTQVNQGTLDIDALDSTQLTKLEKLAGFQQGFLQKISKKMTKAYTNISSFQNEVGDVTTIGITPEGKQEIIGVVKGIGKGKGVEGKVGIGVGKKLILTDVKALGLPLTLLGQSSAKIESDLASTNPPSWYMDILESKAQANLDPQHPAIKSLWDQYRTSILGRENEESDFSKDLSDGIMAIESGRISKEGGLGKLLQKYPTRAKAIKQSIDLLTE